MSDWTIESELLRDGGTDQLDRALENLGLLQPSDALDRIELVTDWHRSGAETYLCRFAVHLRGGGRRDAVIKAYVPAPGPRSIDDYVRELVQRRRRVEEAGVSVPRLYFSGNGVVIEEWIPAALEEYRDLPAYNELLERARWILQRLRDVGFRPVSTFHDFRTDGERIVVIDFGEDLGGVDPAFASDYRVQS